MRQFGGRVNIPTTSLGDLNSRFQIQGDPTLPRLTVTGYFTGQTSIAGPDAGSNYWAIKDSVSIAKGNHGFKFGGEVSYEKIVHDTLLDNYGVFTFNGSKTGNAYADFLLGLPATMTQDAPVRKLDNGAYLSLFAQDDYRIHPRVTLNLGVRYDLQFPFTDPQNRKLAFVPGAQSTVSPTAPVGLLFPGDDGISRGIVKTDYNNIAPRLGMAWDPFGDGRTSVRAAFGMFYGSITGNEWNTTADNQPFTVRQSFPTVFTLSDPYRNLPGGVGPFPFNYDPASPRFTLPAQVFGPSLDFVWPFAYQMNLTVEKEIVRSVSVSASYVGALGGNLPGSIDRNYPVYGAGRDDGERQRAAAVSAGDDRPGARAGIDVRERLSRPADERRAPRQPLVGEGLLHVRQGDGGHRLSGRRTSGGPELESHRAGARAHGQRSHAQLRDVGDLERELSRRIEGRDGAGAAQRLDGVGDHHAAERPAADDQRGPGSQLRRPDQRSRGSRRQSRRSIAGVRARSDRGVVQPRRLRAAGRRHRRQRGPQHRGRPGREERRLRPLPRRPARRPRAAAAASRGDEHVQLRQPDRIPTRV